MKRVLRLLAFSCALIILSAAAFSEDVLNSCIDKYNQVAAREGAPAITGQENALFFDGVYYIDMPGEMVFAIGIDNKGEVGLFSFEGYNPNIDWKAVVLSALLAWDEDINREEAQKHIGEAIDDYGENSHKQLGHFGKWIYTIMETETEGTFAVMFICQDTVRTPSEKPAGEGTDSESDFWEGLFEDDEDAEPYQKPNDSQKKETKGDKPIHKI